MKKVVIQIILLMCLLLIAGCGNKAGGETADRIVISAEAEGNVSDVLLGRGEEQTDRSNARGYLYYTSKELLQTLSDDELAYIRNIIRYGILEEYEYCSLRFYDGTGIRYEASNGAEEDPVQARYGMMSAAGELTKVSKAISPNEDGLREVSLDYSEDLPLEEITDPFMYFQRIKELNALVFLCVQDEASECMNDVLSDLLSQLGLEESLVGAYRNGYAAVLNPAEGQILEEQLSGEPVRIRGRAEGIGYFVYSEGYQSGRLGRSLVLLNGQSCLVGRRGINVVVADPLSRVILDSVCFDTHTLRMTCTRGETGGSIPEEIPFSQVTDVDEYLRRLLCRDCAGELLALAVCDEGSESLRDSTQELLWLLGLQNDLRGDYRQAYLGLIREDMVLEEASDAEYLELSGETDGCVYEIQSAGYDVGKMCSIRLQEEELSVNRRGLNLVLYRIADRQLMDSVSFDTCDESNTARRRE